MNKKKYALKELKIELTYQCSLACIHCSSNATPENVNKIEQTKCLEIIKEASSLGVEEIVFSGGEPLLCEYISEAISYSKKLGMNVGIYTTGNVNKYEEIILECKKRGLKKAVFSIFGYDSKNHELITRFSNSFDKTINAIKYSLSIGIDTEIHFVAMSINYFQLKDLASLVKNIGVRKMSILRFVPQGRGSYVSDYILDRFQHIELKKSIEELRNDGLEIRTGSPYNFLLLNNKPECKAAMDRLIVTPDLRIHPCDAFKQIKAKEIVGTDNFSRLEKYSLEECWNNSPYLNKIRNINNGEIGNPCCLCESLSKCNSGCMAQKYIEFNQLSDRPDPSCFYNKQLIKET